MSATPALVINGAIGAGKTTVLGEISDLLAEVGVPHAAIDLDALSQTFPARPEDPFNLNLAVRNLAGVWANALEFGAERLVLASVVEGPDDLDRMLGAVGETEPFVARLDAPVAELRRRIREREVGTARDWHLARVVELAGILAAGKVDDFVVETAGRRVREIGLEVLAAAGWPCPKR